jgi:hypothetical protein
MSGFGGVCVAVLVGAFGVAASKTRIPASPRRMPVCGPAAIPTKKGYSTV